MPCGLVNVGGASCFLNALLQCLFLCPFPLLQGTDERRAHLHDPQSYAPRSTAKLAPQRNRVTHAQTQKSFCGRFRRTNLHSQLRDSSAQPTSPSTSQRLNNTCIARFTIRGFRDPRNQCQPVLHSSLQGKTRNRHGVDHIPVNTEGRIRTRDPKRHRH